MARKPEIKIVHPRQLIDALNGLNDDVKYLLATARHASDFMKDDSLDPDKTRKVLAPMLDEAVARVARWYEAD